jgi:hypothetical protein
MVLDAVDLRLEVLRGTFSISGTLRLRLTETPFTGMNGGECGTYSDFCCCPEKFDIQDSKASVPMGSSVSAGGAGMYCGEVLGFLQP